MHWTNRKPTQPGWYWFRAKNQKWLTMTEVDTNSHGFLLRSTSFGWLPLPRGQWAGPIAEPEE